MECGTYSRYTLSLAAVTAADVLRLRISQLLAERRLKPVDLNRIMGKSGSWATQMLKGEWNVPVQELDRLASGLEVSVASLFDESALAPMGLNVLPAHDNLAENIRQKDVTSDPAPADNLARVGAHHNASTRIREPAGMADQRPDDEFSERLLGAYKMLPSNRRGYFAERAIDLAEQIRGEDAKRRKKSPKARA